MLGRVAAAALLLAACGTGGDPEPAASSHAGGAPVSCAEAPYDPVLPSSLTVTKGQKVTVGVLLRAGRGDHVVDSARVEVVPPGAPSMPEDEPHPRAVRRVDRTALPPGDTEVAVDFDGTAADGTALPPGSYAVRYDIRSSGRPGSGCDGPPARAYGVLTRLEWRG